MAWVPKVSAAATPKVRKALPMERAVSARLIVKVSAFSLFARLLRCIKEALAHLL